MSPLPVRADTATVSETRRQRRFVQDVLPLLTSLLLHGGLIALGILTYKTVVIMTSATQTPIVTPEALSDIGELSPIPQFHGLHSDSLRPAAQDEEINAPVNSPGLSNKASALLTLTQSGGGGTGENTDDTIAIGPGKTFGRGNGGIGTGTDGAGAGTEGGLGLAPFGPPSVGGTPTFPPGNANKVIFLCDSSGSMMTKFDTLRQELRKAIDRLRPAQQFDVIFFSEDRYLALDPQLLYALPENKRKAYAFLDHTAPHSSSDPIPGLRAAFGAGPELIYMLTDGDFPNNGQVLEEIRKLTAKNRVKINTIAFMDRGEAYEKLLGEIARETGGTFKFVSEQELRP